MSGFHRGVLLAVVTAGHVALCVNGVAAPSRDDLKRGAQLEQQGQFFRAAEAYSRALRLRPADQKARKAMQRIADRAIAEKLSAAAALGDELKLDEAIAEAEAARRMQERLSSLQIVLEQPDAATDRKQELVARRVQALLLEVDRARAEGLWSAAVAHLQQIEALQPRNDDVRDQLHAVWVAWAEANLGEGRLRAAAERLEQAARVPCRQSGVSATRAAAIRTTLGMSGFRKGACRAAVADLRVAERLAPGSVAPGILGEASTCAATCVRLEVGADPNSGIGDSQRASLDAEVRRRVAADASEFLTLKDSGAGNRRSCGGRTVPGADGQPRAAGPYSASFRVTSLSVIRQPAASFTRQTRYQNELRVETLVTYEEYQEVLAGTMSGWVTVSDRGAPGMSLPLPVRVTDEVRAVWQRGPFSTSTIRDEGSRRSSTGMMIDVSGGKATAEEARRESRARLIESLGQRFATEASRLLLTSVDLEPAVPDPTELPDGPAPAEEEDRGTLHP